MVPTTEFIGEMRVSSPMLTLPDGMMTLPVVTARITSSGAMPYERSRSGSTRMTIVRWLPPNGGGDVRPGQRRELRPDAVQRQILDLTETAGVAPEDEIADRHRARVEPHDERSDGARRHEGARAVHVADRLRERLGHVGAGVERQLQQRRVLNRLRFDALDAVDVEEVVLVVVGDVPLHLRRAHAAVRLRHVDDGQIQVGEDVGPHPADGERGRQRDAR